MQSAPTRRQAARPPSSRVAPIWAAIRARRFALAISAWLLLLAGRPAAITEAKTGAVPEVGSVAGTEREAEPGEGAEDEYRVKAAFLYHFIRYTTWPPSAFGSERAPIVVLVVGEDPFGSHLRAALGDKLVGIRPIQIRNSEAVPEAIDAHVVFEGRLDKPERDKLLGLCKGRPVVLLGERPGFAAAGAQGNFYLEGANVRFEINVDAVKASGLEISSQLKRLARIVHSEGSGG